MATTGCYSIQFGFESGNAETLKLIQKGMTVNQYRDAVRWSRAAGLETRGTFMLGFPGETPEMSLNSIKVACELDTDYMLFFAYHVLPGTELEETARREGAICPTHDGDIHQPSYVPNTYPSAEALEDMVRLAYRRYYLRPGYIARSLLRVGGHPASWWNHAKAFAFWAQVALSGKQKPSG
jgi:radical SAM superfamily enzyme YgiQ (UPF0313 family)